MARRLFKALSEDVGAAVQHEIEKVKKRREERALERVQQEEELSMVARERAIAEGVELEAKEELVRPGSRGLHARAPAAPG